MAKLYFLIKGKNTDKNFFEGFYEVKNFSDKNIRIKKLDDSYIVSHEDFLKNPKNVDILELINYFQVKGKFNSENIVGIISEKKEFGRKYNINYWVVK